MTNYKNDRNTTGPPLARRYLVSVVLYRVGVDGLCIADCHAAKRHVCLQRLPKQNTAYGDGRTARYYFPSHIPRPFELRFLRHLLVTK